LMSEFGLSPPGGSVNPMDQQAECPACHAIVIVEAEWRLVQCPKCGEMITRMGGDSSYD
jgi:predicted RNA-binding Zn-ribbon protein involved in translation (DUF1610 family)